MSIEQELKNRPSIGLVYFQIYTNGYRVIKKRFLFRFFFLFFLCFYVFLFLINKYFFRN